jgi:hypothetical protein
MYGLVDEHCAANGVEPICTVLQWTYPNSTDTEPQFLGHIEIRHTEFKSPVANDLRRAHLRLLLWEDKSRHRHRRGHWRWKPTGKRNERYAPPRHWITRIPTRSIPIRIRLALILPRLLLTRPRLSAIWRPLPFVVPVTILLVPVDVACLTQPIEAWLQLLADSIANSDLTRSSPTEGDFGRGMLKKHPCFFRLNYQGVA